jgi:hypothetical protein
MPWRKAHGSAATGGETLVFEHGHGDTAAPAPANDAPPIQREKNGQVRDTEAARALGQRRKNAPDFVRRELVCTPEFEPFDRQRRTWTRSRLAELQAQYGAVSSGVAARVRAAGWGVAFSEFLASRAAETGDLDLMNQSASIAGKASTEDEKARRLAGEEADRRSKTPQSMGDFWGSLGGGK